MNTTEQASAPTLHAENERKDEIIKELVAALTFALDAGVIINSANGRTAQRMARNAIDRSQSLHAQPNGREGAR